MSDITISVIQPPSTTINVGVDETTLIQAGIGLPPHSVTHISGGSDEINHNLLGGLQGGSGNEFYHLNSGQYFNLVTGDIVRPTETGQFYPNSNPSGFITGLNLSNYSTIDYTTGISGGLQNQITSLNNATGSYVLNSETGQFYSNTNPSGYITGINNIVFTTGNQIISGAKTFTGSFNVSTHDPIIIRSTGYTHGVEIGGGYYNRIADGGFVNEFGVDGTENHFGDSATSSNSFGGSASQNDFGAYATLNNYYAGSVIGEFNFDTAPTFIDTIVRDNFVFSSLGATESANPTTLVVRSSLGYSEFSRIISTDGLNSTSYNSNKITLIIDGDPPDTYTYDFPQANGIIALDSTAVMLNGNQTVNGVKNFTSIPTVNNTGVLLSGSSYITGISGGLQTQITTLNNQTGSYYPRTNPSGYITGVDLSFSGNYYTKNESESRYVNTTGTETILGDKTFHDKVYINNLYVTGLETIINTTNTNVASNYLLLNLTGGAVDGGIFFITGSGLTGINDSGAIIGFDHSDKFKFGIGTRASDLSVLNTIAAYEQVTGISGSLQTQISTLNNATGNYVLKIETGQFYSSNNPSGYTPTGYVTGISGNLQTQITNLNNATGGYALNSQTGQFYPNSNPSGFITGIDLSSYATQVYVTGISGDLQGQITNLNNATGDYVLNSQTGQFYANSNPSGFITGVDLSSYATQVYVTGISGDLQTQITNLNSATGSYVLNSRTGDFYASSNPSGFITGIDNIVFTTGDQTISGIKTFNSRPFVNGTGVMLSGEAAQLPTTLVYTTGNQDISDVKNFLSTPTISGNPIATISDPVRTTLIGNGVISGFAISGASGLTNPSALIVAIDGAMQEPIVDYVLNTGSIFFTSPLPSGSKAVVISPSNFYQVGQITPSDGSVTSSKLDNSIQINNLTVANDLTTTNNFTLNGSFTGNSTQNSLPNQTLTNSGSILTRDLMAMFLEKDIYNFSPAGFSLSTAISGAQASANANYLNLRGNTTTQASPNNLAMATVNTHNPDVGFMSITNSSSNLTVSSSRGGASAAYSVLDFSKRVILQFELSTNFRHVASNHNFFARLGPGSLAVNTNTGDALPGTGISIGDSYVAMLMETGSIRLVTNKNLSGPTESPNQLVSPILSYLTPFTTASAKFSLSVYNGTADLYIGNQYIGSQTGCPTHISPFSNGIAFGCNSLAPTTTVGAGYVVSNIKIITLPN